MQAAFQQNVPLFTKLKHAGADLNAIDEDGFSVLNHAENGGPYNPVLNFFLQTLEPEQPHLPAANEHPHPTTPLTQQHVVFFENPAYEGIQGEAFGDLMDNVVRYFAPSH